MEGEGGGGRKQETEGSGCTSKPSMAKQRDTHRPTSIFVKGRDCAPLTGSAKLIMQRSGSSSDSKTELNTNGGEIQNLDKVTEEVRTSEIRIGVK